MNKPQLVAFDDAEEQLNEDQLEELSSEIESIAAELEEEEAKEREQIIARKRKAGQYLTNEELIDEFYKSKALGRMTDTFAKQLMLLTERTSRHKSFVRYNFREDLCSNAMITLVRSWDKFNPEKSNYPFAYYTRVIINAFKQHLNYERKHRNIRDAVLVDVGMNPSYTYAEAQAVLEAIELEERQAAEDDLDKPAPKKAKAPVDYL